MAVQIVLDEKYILTNDEKQYILKKLYGKKVVDRTYYTSLTSAFQDYFCIVIRASNSKSIEELIEVHKNALNHIKTLLKPLDSKIVIEDSKGDLK